MPDFVRITGSKAQIEQCVVLPEFIEREGSEREHRPGEWEVRGFLTDAGKAAVTQTGATLEIIRGKNEVT